MENGMRNWIDLFEKAHSMRTGTNIEVIAVESPSSQQLTVMLDRYPSIRGMVDDEGHMFIWDAMNMTHYGAEMQLGVRIELGFYMAKRPDGKYGCRWADYTGEGHKLEDTPSFQRMTRRIDVVLGTGADVLGQDAF